jgi:hypothetical protein
MTPTGATKASGTSAKIEGNGEQDPSSLLFGLIESTQLAPALKTIFDRDWTEKFQGYLGQSILSKETELHAACDEHFYDLVGSVDNILVARDEAIALQEQLRDLNSRLQATVAQLLEVVDELGSERAVRQNIILTLQVLREVFALVQTVARAFKHIEQRQYYSAFSLINEIKESLPRFEDFAFARDLGPLLPRLTALIRDSSKAEFTHWLSQVIEKCGELGQDTLNHARQKLDVIEYDYLQQRCLKLKTLSPGSQVCIINTPDTPESGKKNSDGKNPDGSPSTPESLDFPLTLAPLHQAVYVYSSLGQLGDFQRIYCERRTAHILR